MIKPSDLLEQVTNFVWLRWRIQSNHLSKSSAIGKVIAALMLVAFGMGSFAALAIGTALGIFLPRLMAREYYFLLWNGLIAVTCVMWLFYLIADLQRSEAITFDRLLHLPISFAQVFAINYVSSWLGLHTLCLTGLGFGFIVGSTFSLGPITLLFFLPFLAFLIALTALTYQFQGWIATLMSNPRKRRAILIGLPFVLVALIQVPAVVLSRFADRDERQAQVAEPELTPQEVVIPETGKPDLDGETAVASPETPTETLTETPTESKPESSIESPTEDPTETKESDAIVEEKSRAEVQAANKVALDKLISQVRLANLLVPPFWLAGSIDSILSGNLHVLWLTPMMLLVAWLSLRSNYRATMRFYKGETDARAATTSRRAKEDLAIGKSVAARRSKWIDFGLPGLHDETNAVLGLTWQSMLRAPEVKLYLLLPFISPFILFGALQAWKIPPVDELKAGLVVVASAFTMLMAAGLISNQFGFDRTGFRAFVLSPIRRDRILLARNIAIAPFLLIQSTLLAIAVSVYFGFSFDKLFCSVILTAAMLPTFCLLMNLMSILTPFALAAGSIQPQQFNFIPLMTNMGLSMFLPVIVGFTLMPLGLEWLMDQAVSSTRWFPFALLLSVPWVGFSFWLYALVIPWQGKLLARREQEILRVVTSKAE